MPTEFKVKPECPECQSPNTIRKMMVKSHKAGLHVCLDCKKKFVIPFVIPGKNSENFLTQDQKE